MGRVQPLDVSGLTLGAIATVFTIGYVANMLGGDEAVNRHLPRRRMPTRQREQRDRPRRARHRVLAADHRRRTNRVGSLRRFRGSVWRLLAVSPPPPRPAEPAKSRNPLHLLERPGSPLGRNPMESDEEQVANLTTRSGEALLKCHRSDLIHRPGDGTLLRAKGVSNRPNLQSPLVSGLRPQPARKLVLSASMRRRQRQACGRARPCPCACRCEPPGASPSSSG